MPISILTFISFIKKHFKAFILVLTLLLLIPIYNIIKGFFKQTQAQESNDGYQTIMQIIDNLVSSYSNQGYDFGLTYEIMLSRTEVIASALGTHKNATTFTEDEVLAHAQFDGVYNGDFKIYEYLYANIYTDERSLQTDLRSYLDTDQYEDINHLFTL